MTRPAPSRGAWQAVSGAIATIALAMALATLYQAISRASGLNAWQAAASLHTGLAAVVLILNGRSGRLGDLVARDGPRWAYAPAAIVAGGTALLAAVTPLFMPPAATAPLPATATMLAFVVWIPLIEEIVFRVGFGGVARARLGPLVGAWFSALAFALVHAAPTLDNVAAGKVGLPLGPFLLALICEALFIKTGRLWPIVLLHAACNGTVFIFSVLDSRWLQWLGLLYL